MRWARRGEGGSGVPVRTRRHTQVSSQIRSDIPWCTWCCRGLLLLIILPHQILNYHDDTSLKHDVNKRSTTVWYGSPCTRPFDPARESCWSLRRRFHLNTMIVMISPGLLHARAPFVCGRCLRAFSLSFDSLAEPWDSLSYYGACASSIQWVQVVIRRSAPRGRTCCWTTMRAPTPSPPAATMGAACARPARTPDVPAAGPRGGIFSRH